MAFYSSGEGPSSESLIPDRDAPRFGVLATVRAYWQSLRQGDALPNRDAIDPRAIAKGLESTFLVERVAPGVARFRIAGMHLHDVLGLDVRGMPLSTLFDPTARPRLSDGVEAVFSCPAIVEMGLNAERGLGRPQLEGRMLLLPLTDTHGDTSLALGCLAMVGGLGRAPRRFAVMGLMREAVYSAQSTVCPADGTDPHTAFTALPSLRKATIIRPLWPKNTMTRARSHLRLVYSRD